MPLELFELGNEHYNSLCRSERNFGSFELFGFLLKEVYAMGFIGFDDPDVIVTKISRQDYVLTSSGEPEGMVTAGIVL